MKAKTIAVAVASNFLCVGFVVNNAMAAPQVSTLSIECNWGTLTMEPISDGLDQGGHSLDTSGDGEQSRVGFVTVVDQSKVDATCNLIEYLMVGNAGR